MVELLDVFGNDLMIVNSARVSYGKKSDAINVKDEKLINFLVEHKHIAPFRHPQLQFRITCPIYVERQLRKHEIGIELGLAPEPNSSINSISGRYVDFSDSYTTIKEWRKQSTSSKQGSAEPMNQAEQYHCSIRESQVIDLCKKVYNEFIEMGMSKEQARTILPLNLNTTFIWTGSFLSFIHLFNLRLKKDTQQETRELVELMLIEVRKTGRFDLSLKAFGL
jgi:thymidylate synthase (FAD)